MTRYIAAERHLAWSSIKIRGERLAKDRLSCASAVDASYAAGNPNINRD
jgi:hypothetical protein